MRVFTSEDTPRNNYVKFPSKSEQTTLQNVKNSVYWEHPQMSMGLLLNLCCLLDPSGKNWLLKPRNSDSTRRDLRENDSIGL